MKIILNVPNIAASMGKGREQLPLAESLSSSGSNPFTMPLDMAVEILQRIIINEIPAGVIMGIIDRSMPEYPGHTYRLSHDLYPVDTKQHTPNKRCYRITTRNIGQGSFGSIHDTYEYKLFLIDNIRIETAKTKRAKVTKKFLPNHLATTAAKEQRIYERLYSGTRPPFTRGQFAEYFLLRKISGDNLYNILQNPLSYLLALAIAIAIVRILFRFHRWYIHNDLKPRNIMIDGKDGPKSDIQAYLIDFDAADETPGPIPVPKGHFICNGRTMLFMPPELLDPVAPSGHTSKKTQYDQTADIYSLGVTFALLFSTPAARKQIYSNPLTENPVIMKQIRPGGIQILTSTCNPEIVYLLQHMTTKIPSQRPSLLDINTTLRDLYTHAVTR